MTNRADPRSCRWLRRPVGIANARTRSLDWQPVGGAISLLFLAALTGPTAARQVSVAQVHALATVADESSVGVGGGLGIIGAGRVGAGGSLTLARYRGSFAVRGELLVSFHLDPGRRRGISPYAVAGAALVGTGDGAEQYVVFTVGLEAAPRVRRRWFIELGFGGGIRTAVGLRWQPPFLRR